MQLYSNMFQKDNDLKHHKAIKSEQMNCNSVHIPTGRYPSEAVIPG